MDINSFRKADAIIRIVCGVDPATLSDKEYAKLINDYVFVKRFESEIQKINLQNALSEVLEKMFSNASEIGI